MTDSTTFEEELGPDLAKIREQADMSQQKLGEKLKSDASRISRIEGGKIKLAMVDVEAHLRAIGTPLANLYIEYRQLEWKVLPRPLFWHPDWQVLHAADGALSRCDHLASTLSPNDSLRPQLDMHRESLLIAARFLDSTQHDLAFVGETGIGKTFAICCITGLTFDPNEAERLTDRMILEIGQGWTTLCEVRIVQGPRYGLIIDPQGEDELRALIRDFRTGLTQEENSNDELHDGPHGVSEEIDRALRNLMGLVIQEHRDNEGKVTHYVDPFDDLRQQFATSDELQAELYNRVRLQDRTTTQLWQDESPGMPPKAWLKKTFQDVNNGLRPDVPLPGRIDVVVPHAPLGSSPYSIRLVDTKGLDKTAIRRDIQDRIDDPRTFLVLCTRFNSLAVSLQGLLEHVRDTGAKHVLNHRVALLVLPQRDEAGSMKTPSRKLVESDEQGYELNRLRLKPQLDRLSANNVRVLHMNALRDPDVKAVVGQCKGFIQEVRSARAEQIDRVDKILEDLIEHHQEAVSQAAHKEVRRQLANLLERLHALPPQGKPVYMGVLNAVKSLHHRTVHAAVVRNGNWHNLNVYLYLGAGAAADAQLRSTKFFTQLEGQIEQMLTDPNLARAHGFLRQLAENAERWRAQFLETARRGSEELLREPLYRDYELWAECGVVRGQGYREQIADVLLNRGFEKHKQLLEVLETHVQREWETKVLDQFRKLFGP